MALRVWLPLNRDLRNQGLENVTVSTYGSTQSNYARKFTASVSTNYSHNVNNDSVSFGGWFKFNKAEIAAYITNYVTVSENRQTPTGQLIGYGHTGDDIGIVWEANNVYTDGSFTGFQRIFAFTRNNGYDSVSIGSGEIEYDTWIHYFLTYDVNTRKMSLYKNGTFIAEKTAPNGEYLSGIFNINHVGTYGGNGPAASIPFLASDVRIYDHALSKKEVAELARGCILHYPMNDTLNESTVNLITSIGNTTRCTKEGNGVRIDWTKTENQGDTYFFFNTLEPVVSGETYTLSFDAHGIISNGIRFNWSNLDDSQYQCFIKEGHNELTFTVGDVLSTFFDDKIRDNTNNFWMGNFQLEKKDHATPYTSSSRPENFASLTWHSNWSNSGSATWNWNDTSITNIPSSTTKVFSISQTTDGECAICLGRSTKDLPSQTITVSTWFYMSGDDIGSPIQPYIRSSKTDGSVGSLEFNGSTSIASWPKNTWIKLTKTITTASDATTFYICAYTRKAGSKFAFNGWEIIKGVNYLKDVSGFDNHSLITGSLSLVTTPKSARYDKCMNIDNSGTNKNYANCTIAAPQVKSASFWVYIGDNNPTNQVLFGHRLSHLAFGFYTTNACLTYIAAGDSDGANSQFDITNTKKNSWNHFVISQTDNLNIDLFLNGIKLTNPVSQCWGYQTSDDLYIGRRMRSDGGNIMYYTGQVSDFRLFSRVLTQADVDDLYKDSLVIDKNQNGYIYELNELDSQTSVDVKKNGQLKCKTYSETITSFYDDNAYVEPDGSVWIRIFHHNNPANTSNLFAQTDSFTTKVYKNENAWFDIAKCNLVNKWELMIKQEPESGSNYRKYRWIQIVNPMTAVFGDVDSSDITKISGNGYTTMVDGGIYKSNGATYLNQNNGNSGNWWGAIGAWTQYQSGIPGFEGWLIKTGYTDLYLRIDNLDESTIARIGKTGVTFNELHEM